MKNWSRAILLFSAVLFLTAGKASADSLITYQFSGAGISASFELPVSPTVLSSNPGFNSIVMPINLMINGVNSSDGLDFFSGVWGGGFSAFNGGNVADINVTGPQLYTGPESAPTMALFGGNGVMLSDFTTGDPAGTLTTAVTSTPEPSATVLLGVGLLAIGLAALRFNPSVVVTAN